MVKVQSFIAPGIRSVADAEEVLARRAAFVKLVTGVTNNAAYYCMLDAVDAIKKGRLYRNELKKRVRLGVDAYRRYELSLLHRENDRFFRVGDMSESTRKRYSDDLTDRDYFELWLGLGAKAYTQNLPLIQSLRHKYLKSLESHGVKYAYEVSWISVCICLLELSVRSYHDVVGAIHRECGLPTDILHGVFGQFNLSGVCQVWKDVLSLATKGYDFKLDFSEYRNIALGLEDLKEAFLNIEGIIDTLSGSIEEYDEMFRTKGEQKKALREVADLRNYGDAV